MKKKLRTLLVWTLVSLLLQFLGYSFLNNRVQKVLDPMVPSEPKTLLVKTSIPGSELKNIQISYSKDYLAYLEKGTLKVFNIKNQQIVFEKESPMNDKTLGVIAYQWLPDRDTLLYFYAKKNPNPVTTYVTITPPKTLKQTTKQTTTSFEQKTEDPNQKTVPEVPKVVPEEPPATPRVEKRYGNPQITELYSLEFPNNDETIAPNDNFKKNIDAFPAGGQIENLVFSTPTNLLYLIIKNKSTELLMEINIMKNETILNKSTETIDNIATSDRYGTLIIDSIVGTNRQVVALEGNKRQIISNNKNDVILGIKMGKVYIGEVNNNQLLKIKVTTELAQYANTPSLKTEWEGTIPFDNSAHVFIGAKGQLIAYNHQTAYIVTDGKLAEIKLHGDNNYISPDGSELIQLTKGGNSTLTELQPLQP